MHHNDASTWQNLSRLDDSDLVLFAQQKKVVRCEGIEVCFNGLRYCSLATFPVKLGRELRQDIIDALVNSI